MENKIDLKNEIHYVVDYRSMANSLGSIFLDKVGGNRQLLITDQDVGPKDMKEAHEQIKPEALPDDVIHIPLDNQFWDVVNQTLGAILVSHYVAYVSDSELAGQYPELVCDPRQHLFLIQDWLKARNIKGIL